VKGDKSSRVGSRHLYWAVLLGLLTSVALTPIGSAQAADPLPVPPGFRLPGSNGYALYVFAVQDPKTGQGHVFLLMRSRHAWVSYTAPALVTQTSIEADLGPVGQIDVDFIPSGQIRTEHSSCSDDSVSVDSGSFVGSIEFSAKDLRDQVGLGPGADVSFEPIDDGIVVRRSDRRSNLRGRFAGSGMAERLLEDRRGEPR
jgi:hypothetical protein